MEVKKSPEADLERRRPLWLLVGYAVALSLVFIALEWRSPEEKFDADGTLSDLLFEEELDIPLPETLFEPPPPPPPAVETPAPPEQLDVVDNETPLEKETPLPPSSEITEGTPLPELIPEEARPIRAAEDQPYLLVDELPEFSDGGLPGLMRYLTQHVRYPAFAQRNRIQGRVLCQFIVNADGSIADVQVLTGVHPTLDREATRVLSTMPPWKPGKLKGKPVRVRFTLPVEFRLQ